MEHKVRRSECARLPMKLFMTRWDRCSCPVLLLSVLRGRPHDTLSESRMREIRTSGSMSGMWKRGSKLPRHISTLHTTVSRPNEAA